MILEETQQRQLVNQTQAAKILGVKRMTVYRWVKKGKLKPSAIVNGGTPLFDLADLEAHKNGKAA